MASIRQKSNSWAVRFWAHGQEWSTTVPKKGNTRTDLQKRANKLERKFRNGESWEDIRADLRGEHIRVAKPKTLDYYMEHHLQTTTAKHATKVNYRNTYRRVWMSKFGTRLVDSLLTSELKAHLASFGYTPEHQRSVRSVLRLALLEAKGDKVLTELATDSDSWKIKGKSRGKNKAKRAYTEGARDAVLQALHTAMVEEDTPDSYQETAWRFFMLAFYTGMRTEELLAIQKRHLQKPRILIEQVRTGNLLVDSPKTSNSVRWVEVPSQVWDLVIAPWQFREWLFTGPKGKPFTQANRMMIQFQKAHDASEVERPLGASGRPMPYPWRSTYISMAIKGSVDPTEVARQVGDDVKTVFDEYVEFIPSEADVGAYDRTFNVPGFETEAVPESGTRK